MDQNREADKNVVRFARLFRSNDRSYGAVTANMTKVRTIKGHPITLEACRSHLEGMVGLGAVPILDDDNCWWAAIDIDTHGPKGRQFDLIEFAAKVERYKYPLFVCRSRSGGAHLYVFFAEPTPAASIRPLLARWAAVLGWPEAEVFPKQSTLNPALGENERALGNWLNLPYYDAKQTIRYCIVGGKEIAFEHFLDLTENGRYKLTRDGLGDTCSTDYTGGPPCLQEMMKKGVEEGHRNTAIYQASVYLKRAFPNHWQDKVGEFNSFALAHPLGHKELRQITRSVGRKDYNYKCREEPCVTFCDRELCRTREYGITDADSKANELPPFDRIEKVIASPIRWVLHIRGQQVELSTSDLFDFNRVRTVLYERLNVLVPRMKGEEWDVHLRDVAERASVRYETTVEDMIFTKMCDFVRRAHQDRTVGEDQRREALLRRMPALISISDVRYRAKGQVDEKGRIDEVGRLWYYAFRAQDFIEYMRRRKALTVAEHQVHTLLHRVLELSEEGSSLRDKFRVGNQTLRNVWLVPEQMVAGETVPTKKFESEF